MANRARNEESTFQAPLEDILKSKGADGHVEELNHFVEDAADAAEGFLQRRGALIGSIAGALVLGWLARNALRARQ